MDTQGSFRHQFLFQYFIVTLMPDAHSKSSAPRKHNTFSNDLDTHSMPEIGAAGTSKLKKAAKNVSFAQSDAIQWPLRLFDDAADYDYTNDAIQTPLYEAYSSVCDIISGRQPHTITLLFSAHMTQQRVEFTKANPSCPTTKDLLQAAACFPFSVPVLPGDASLAVDFMASLMHHAKGQLIGDCVIEGIAQALFNLVILRTYLGRPPENDLDIFEAVKNGQITRVWTSHEQALAARYGEEDTGPDAVFDTVPNPDLWGIEVKRDITFELTEDRPFVAIKQPITWTNRPGLTGGPLKPRRYKPPYLRALPPGPRPKPRPAYGTQLASDNAVSTYTSATTSVARTKRLSNVLTDAEAPVSKRRSTGKQPEYHHDQGDQLMEMVGPPAKVPAGT
jgi:hypothetical protein